MEFMAALPPELVAQKIKVEDVPVNIWDTLGLPASGKRDEEEITAMQQQQAQMQAAQQGQPPEGAV